MQDEINEKLGAHSFSVKMLKNRKICFLLLNRNAKFRRVGKTNCVVGVLHVYHI